MRGWLCSSRSFLPRSLRSRFEYNEARADSIATRLLVAAPFADQPRLGPPALQLRNLTIVIEGFPTYGGIACRCGARASCVRARV